MFKKILVPLDGSDMAEAVLPNVRSLAQCFESEITLLQVLIPIPMSYYGATVDMVVMSNLEQSARTAANSYIQKTVAHLEDLGIKARAVIHEELSAADFILTYAEQNGIDLIAMSTHGRTGIGRWLLGSVADRVMNHAKTPVLLVRPDLSA